MSEVTVNIKEVEHRVQHRVCPTELEELKLVLQSRLSQVEVICQCITTQSCTKQRKMASFSGHRLSLIFNVVKQPKKINISK